MGWPAQNECMCGCGQKVSRRENKYILGHRHTLEGRLRDRSIYPESGCWEWTGAKNSGGYGFIWNDGSGYVHRAAYELFLGQIPSGMIVCHRCDNPSCWNPEHLFLGTYKDNRDDMIAKGRGRTKNGDPIPATVSA
jgi:HNH endonuclease